LLIYALYPVGVAILILFLLLECLSCSIFATFAFDDGFLSDPALSSLIIEGRGPEYVEMYQKINLANRNHWLNDHGFDLFGIPREIKMGMQVSF
jgi:hypothetical protein